MKRIISHNDGWNEPETKSWVPQSLPGAKSKGLHFETWDTTAADRTIAFHCIRVESSGGHQKDEAQLGVLRPRLVVLTLAVAEGVAP